MATHKIILDTFKVQSLPKILTARMGEKGACVIVAEIASGGAALSLEGYTARFECVTTAQKVVRDTNCTISGNTVTYTLDESVTTSTGLITVAYFALLKDTTVIETTENFAIKVLRNAESLGSGVPENYYSEIDDLIAILEQQKQEYAAAESSRATAESSRVEAESSRVSAESTRASKETARQSAESTRETKETARQTAEGARVVAESARVNAEAARVGAETGRMTAETSRATEEGKRVSAESARATNETAREAAVASATNAANEATTNANTATTAANDAATKAETATSASATQTAACAAATTAAMDVATTALSKRRADTLYANALIGNASGDIVQVEDAWSADALGLMIAGKAVQNGTPTPDAPVPIINVTSPVRIRTHDGIFHIKHSGGLFDWSIINADNLTWHFPDGTTSNADQPLRAIDAGTVKVVCDDWTKGSMQINDNDTNSAFVGDLSDLPPLTYYLKLSNCSLLTGDLSELPPVTYALGIINCSLLTGVLNVAGTVKTIYLQGTGMSASDTDQTLINLAATTTVTSGGILQIKKNRTSASDAAFDYLSSRFTITEV